MVHVQPRGSDLPRQPGRVGEVVKYLYHPGIVGGGMVKILDGFRHAARLAREIGAPGLIVDMADGYLLASFLSPLTNRREDHFGGSLEGRMRFPLEVFDAVLREWAAERLLGVRLSATDFARA